MKSYFAIVILSLLSLNIHAAVQKWVDADGNIHYSDTRPDEDTETKSVRTFVGKDSAGASPSYTPKTYAEREAEMKKAKQGKEEEQKKKTQQDAVAEAKKSNCAAARENARTLETGARIVTYDDKGESTYLDDDARAQRMEEARKAISANCN
jgi:hypothetical protein